MISGLVFAGVFLAIVAFVIWAGRGAAKLQKELPDRIARAKPAKATVTALAKGGVQNQGVSVFSMVIDLSVHPEGGEPYAATAFWEVRDLDFPRLQPGSALEVKIDATDPRVIYSPQFETSVAALATFLESSK